MSQRDEERVDWTAPAAELHDAMVERYCVRHPEYDPNDDDFGAANAYADEMVARNAR